MKNARFLPSLRRGASALAACACLAVLSALPAGCNLGGGTDVGNPELSIRVTGSIKHMDGSPANGIPLHLRPASHLTTLDTNISPAPPDSFQQDGWTDTQGFFSFDSVPRGEYRIEAMDTNSRGAVIGFSANGSAADVTLNTAFLDSTGSISGHINYLRSIKVGYPKITIAVYGMDRATFATNDGNYTVSNLPPGKYKLHIVVNSDSTLSAVVPEIPLVAGQHGMAGSVDLGP